MCTACLLIIWRAPELLHLHSRELKSINFAIPSCTVKTLHTTTALFQLAARDAAVLAETACCAMFTDPEKLLNYAFTFDLTLSKSGRLSV